MQSNYSPSLANRYNHFEKHFKQKKLFMDELSNILN